MTFDSLLDQAAAYAQRRRDDGSFVGFDFACADATSAADVLDGKHDAVEMREERSDDGGRQRGMYSKRDLEAGTRLVVAQPIVVCWDAEDGFGVDDEDDDTDDLNDIEEILRAQLGSDDSGDDDSEGDDECYVNQDGDKAIAMETKSGKFVDQLDPASRCAKEPCDEDNRKASSLNTSDSDHGSGDDSDDDGSVQEATGTKRNGTLILRALDKIEANPSLWTDTLSTLFPRDASAALALPPWFCADASVGLRIETRLNALASLALFPSPENAATCKDIALRLPSVVRYNVLSLETCSELFVYPDASRGGLAELAGTGLYGPEISYFNHSCVRPNVSRYCVGDVMFFVANRDIGAGEELCYSYIEHELLCENAAKRSGLLNMDFELEDTDRRESDDSGDEGDRPAKRQKVARMPRAKEAAEVHYPLIDAEMQSELMATPAAERLELIAELVDQTADAAQDYQCDKYQLHILQALTLDGLGRSDAALPAWETALAFAVQNFPPADETTVALRVQAALCAIQGLGGDQGRRRAERHAEEALKMHDVLFGGGKQRFLKRYEQELASPVNRSMPKATVRKNVRALFG